MSDRRLFAHLQVLAAHSTKYLHGEWLGRWVSLTLCEQKLYSILDEIWVYVYVTQSLSNDAVYVVAVHIDKESKNLLSVRDQ